jgi:hypothetical protein
VVDLTVSYHVLNAFVLMLKRAEAYNPELFRTHKDDFSAAIAESKCSPDLQDRLTKILNRQMAKESLSAKQARVNLLYLDATVARRHGFQDLETSMNSLKAKCMLAFNRLCGHSPTISKDDALTPFPPC